jgi:hypothetical protein
MVYNTQGYWGFLTFPSSSILETRNHDVSETGSVSVLRWKGGEKTPTQLGALERAILQWLRLALSKGPNWAGCFLPPFHLRMETDPVSEMSRFLVSRIPDDGKVQKKTVILCLYKIVYRTTLGSKPHREWKEIYVLIHEMLILIDTF